MSFFSFLPAKTQTYFCMTTCFHCGDPCPNVEIKSGELFFCCHGCKTVYEILNENDLSYYYDLEKNPGISPAEVEGKFDFLDNESISEKLLEFNDGNMGVISFSIDRKSTRLNSSHVAISYAIF